MACSRRRSPVASRLARATGRRGGHEPLNWRLLRALPWLLLLLLCLAWWHVLSRIGEGIHERAYLERTRDGEQYRVHHERRPRVIRHHEPVVVPTVAADDGDR